jgi:hypothetical protein
MQSAILGDQTSKHPLEINELPEIIQIGDTALTILNGLAS